MRIIKPEIIGHFEVKTKSSSLMSMHLPNHDGISSTKDSKRVDHRAHSIYSMDFQPHSYRLATAGGDCKVKIWNTELFLAKKEIRDDDEKVKADMKENSLLATLCNHTKSVNIVRWSQDGSFLASGGDDNLILIYKYTPGAISNTGDFGSNGSTSAKESWTRVFTLQGHTMDVLDLDWSPTNVIASASIDNKILLWDLNDNDTRPVRTPTKILSEHKSFVKGLTFDPIGKFLVSCGSDNLVIIWDCEANYSIVRVLDGPLKNSADSTMFRRASWSPDGQSLCITAALKADKPVGMVLKRGTWQ